MSKKLGGKKLLIITTCVSVIAAVSLFRDEPQNLLAGTKTALYNGQNVVYDSQKAGGSQVAYKTYCTDSNCTFLTLLLTSININNNSALTEPLHHAQLSYSLRICIVIL